MISDNPNSAPLGVGAGAAGMSNGVPLEPYSKMLAYRSSLSLLTGSPSLALGNGYMTAFRRAARNYGPQRDKNRADYAAEGDLSGGQGPTRSAGGNWWDAIFAVRQAGPPELPGVIARRARRRLASGPLREVSSLLSKRARSGVLRLRTGLKSCQFSAKN